MALVQSPSIVTNGLVFYYDMNNIQKSWKGVPTTNVSSGYSIGIYNNVPGHVTASISTTGEYYQGSTVYKLTLTPTTATGVSYLTGGNNPGIGVVTSGGGGTANTYTGHSIFYKPTVTMYSTPLFTNYSNIPGYGAGSLGSNSSVAVGNGWYCGQVIWYDTVTRSDGKYWAINPAGATINIPIDIYWAGPFREDRNSSTFVAPFVNGTRSTTQALVDQTSNYTVTAASPTYNSNNTFSFTGSGQRFDTNLTTFGNNATWEAWINGTSNLSGYNMFMGRYLPYFGFYNTDRLYFSNLIGGAQCTISTAANLTINTWYQAVFTTSYDGTNTTMKIYTNGVETATGTYTGAQGLDGSYSFAIGDGYNTAWYPYAGQVSNVKVYNKTLSAAEVQQNFNALRGRYGV